MMTMTEKHMTPPSSFAFAISASSSSIPSASSSAAASDKDYLSGFQGWGIIVAAQHPLSLAHSCPTYRCSPPRPCCDDGDDDGDGDGDGDAPHTAIHLLIHVVMMIVILDDDGDKDDVVSDEFSETHQQMRVGGVFLL